LCFDITEGFFVCGTASYSAFDRFGYAVPFVMNFPNGTDVGPFVRNVGRNSLCVARLSETSEEIHYA
jgi:hypothetical protein